MAIFNNHIFFPTDFSTNAEHALSFAAEIAYKTGAKLTLFHANQDPVHSAPSAMDFTAASETSHEETVRKINTRFDKLIDNLKGQKKYQDLTISTLLQSGQATASLLNQIDQDQPDLVVMGTQGSTSSRKAILGSVTANIVQKSEAPVLAVPNGSTMDTFERILFTTDYNDGDLDALEHTIEFAQLFNASVDILHIAEQDNLESEIKFRGIQSLINDRFVFPNMEFHKIHEHDFFPGIADYVTEHPVSLVVMVRYKKSFWERLAQRSHSKEMAFYSKVPLLMLKGNHQERNQTEVEDINATK